ncbi:hypothetical protein [Pseudomonas sp. C11]|uniref:hypothetical protein n=1 Tax=Pseudomonas sp. C11 TaxID=3075550 RepID=UPI002AFF7DA4|nr:hypothetical protein [Pseudomonas sp. C11]
MEVLDQIKQREGRGTLRIGRVPGATRLGYAPGYDESDTLLTRLRRLEFDGKGESRSRPLASP